MVLTVFLSIFCDLSRRPGFLLWILVALLYLIDLCFVLDSDNSAIYVFNPATFYGLRFVIMAAEKKCCVPSCGLDGEILHKFPNPIKDADRFKTWIYNVGGDILGKDDDYIFKYRRVCHLHFESKFHTRSKMLSNNAVPTLNLSRRFSAENRTPMLITEQVANLLPSIPSTSGHFSVQKQCLMDITNQVANLPPAIPSTSGQQRHTCDDVMDVDKLQPRTSLSVKPRIFKKHSNEHQLVQQIKKLQKKKNSYVQRLKKAKQLFTNSNFQSALKKFKTLAAIFTVMQFREINKPKMGRRFTRKEKIMALSLYKMGPRAYRWLSKIFVLPSAITLSRLVSNAGLKPGYNENIFNQLAKKADGMKADDKLCTLIFDEMALTPYFDYNTKKDKISGFVNYKGEQIRKIADHVIVFMIRGIVKNYKQPIYYGFSAGSTPKLILAELIKDIIQKLNSIGFHVLATVCDQGTSNTSAINHLIEETRIKYLRENNILKNSVFEVDGKRIIPLYDVPHLLKGLRNNLLTKNLKYTIDGQEKTAKWDHIKILYDNNPTYKGLKLIKNLTENHCHAEKIPKMKVKYASQVLSQTVGKTMGYLADIGILPEDAKETADFIIFIDNLFDSMNGSLQNSKIRSGKELLRNVTPNSLHKTIWTNSKKILKTMKFVSAKGSVGSVPSINNWLHTIENMELLRDTLFYDYNIKSMWCRHLNQDPLENFFGSIRSHGIRNVSPTCAAFEAAFASLLINNLSSNYAVGSNCEDDACAMFGTFEEIFFCERSSKVPTETSTVDLDDVNDNIIINYEEKIKNPAVKAQLEYVTGYLLRKCRFIINKCKHCEHKLFEKNENENAYITCREYIKNKKYLVYPNKNLKEFFSCLQDIVHNVLKCKSHINNIKTYSKTLLHICSETNFIDCPEHKHDLIEYFFDFTSKFFAYNWCKSTNKLLCGTTKVYDAEDYIQIEAFNYYYKRKRNK